MINEVDLSKSLVYNIFYLGGIMFYIGKEKEEFIPDVMIGYGTEGKVYYNKNSQEAVKIFYTFNGYDAVMDEDEALKMSRINTEYILLPRRLVYDERGFFAGYTTKYIKSDVGLYDLFDIYNKLYKDIETLSNEKIILTDILKEGNHVFGDCVYLIDPGYYYFSDASTIDIMIKNINNLNKFFDTYMVCEDSLVRKKKLM